MQTRKVYAIKITKPGYVYSAVTGKLRTFNRARRLVARLKRQGHDAAYAPFMVDAHASVLGDAA